MKTKANEKAVVTVVGKDKVGILAKTATACTFLGEEGNK